MGRILTQQIQGTECIGDSLQTKINPSFLNLDEAVQSLSSTFLVPIDTPTVDLAFNTSNRQLNATVRDTSITNAKLAFDGGSLGFRNKIINGNFDIWQRGTSFNSPVGESYTADRWKYTRYTTGAVTNVSRQSFAVGQTDVPNNPKYFIRLAVGTPGDVGLAQSIEDVTTLAGKTVTYSFWAKASAPTTIGHVFLIQAFGTGGSPSPIAVVSGSVNAPVTTSWTQITGTLTLPSVLGKTIGTDSNDCLQLRIDIGETFTGTFDIAQVQLEEGATATPFEQRPVGLELNLCQRYFEILEPGVTSTTQMFGAFPGGGSASSVTWQFKTRKRAIPTITLASGSVGTTDANITRDFVNVRTASVTYAVIRSNSTANAEL